MTSTLAEKAPGSPSAPAKARAGARRAKRRRTALFFMAPALVGFLVFFGYPLIATVYYSFTKYDLINPPQFIGFDNYVRMFTTEPLVGVAAYNTLWLVVILTTCRVLFSLGIASVISRLKSGVGLVRTLCYLPTLAPPAAATLAFVFVFNPEFGPVNRFLRLIGIDGGLWFNSPAMSKPALTLLALWGSGELMIIILAALLDVPTEQYEAAELDGAYWSASSGTSRCRRSRRCCCSAWSTRSSTRCSSSRRRSSRRPLRRARPTSPVTRSSSARPKTRR